MSDSIKEELEKARRELRGIVDETRLDLEDLVEESREKLADSRQDIARWIANSPMDATIFATVCIALGAALGRMW